MIEDKIIKLCKGSQFTNSIYIDVETALSSLLMTFSINVEHDDGTLNDVISSINRNLESFYSILENSTSNVVKIDCSDNDELWGSIIYGLRQKTTYMINC